MFCMQNRLRLLWQYFNLVVGKILYIWISSSKFCICLWFLSLFFFKHSLFIHYPFSFLRMVLNWVFLYNSSLKFQWSTVCWASTPQPTICSFLLQILLLQILLLQILLLDESSFHQAVKWRGKGELPQAKERESRRNSNFTFVKGGRLLGWY